ncbi:7TM diverse intracellular signaling domain-containing protein [Fusibacter ferrireducens]|uniref:Histidine kinase n=1 Tax=Fusibacter ferrireducens TaxID=2785058 RepID=A0ABR9ZU01_9FIRM|nr:7TM diverse intracellular signaling domain-containing protein [Fusibacter ferrireducens]MBF4693360.1 histidine kinase [Fusibacter ferrireducens]
MKKYLKLPCGIALLMGLIFALFYILEEQEIHTDISFEYLEDASGERTIDEIVNRADFKTAESEYMSFGTSNSAWWIRFKTAEDIFLEQGETYLTIYNPTVGSVDFYRVSELSSDQHSLRSPASDQANDQLVYEHYKSGWMNGNESNDEGYFFPVFKLASGIECDNFCYIKLHSPFTQNYVIRFLNAAQYKKIQMIQFILLGLLSGIILAVLAHSLIIYLELKEKSYLIYFFYTSVMLLYQLNLFGIYSIFKPFFYQKLMSLTISLGLIALILSIVFFKSFFLTKAHRYNRFLNVMIVLLASGIVLNLFYAHSMVNTYSHFVSLVYSISVLYMAISIYRQGVKEARFYIWGWGMITGGIAVTMLRHYGIIPNNSLTLNIIFFSVAMNAIFISTALVDRVKFLAREKERAQLLHKEAEITAKINELAFLQAQIKPHFLYNALNVIASISVIDGEKARDLIMDIAEYLRHTFDFKNLSQYVTLEEEIEYVDVYFSIEQARFGDRIELFKQFEDLDCVKIPPLVIQPLVENAIKHGLFMSKGKGIIEIKGYREGDYYVLEVMDNGVGMTAEKIETILTMDTTENEGIGLINIQKRLLSYYDQSLEIISVVGEGTRIILRIPIRTGGRKFENHVN